MVTRRINYQWITWGISSAVEGGLTDDVRARIDADRTRAEQLRVVTRRIPIVWVEDHSVRVRFVGHSRRLGGVWRRSAELTFGASNVYLESIGGGRPAFGFTDLRIYLDGDVAGRAHMVGGLGGYGRRGPAVAMLRDDLAFRVDREEQHLELITRHEPGSKKRELLAAARRRSGVRGDKA